MAKRHQARRRRAYGPRHHEVHERRLRRHEAALGWLGAPEGTILEAERAFEPLHLGPWLGRDAEAIPARAID